MNETAAKAVQAQMRDAGMEPCELLLHHNRGNGRQFGVTYRDRGGYLRYTDNGIPHDARIYRPASPPPATVTWAVVHHIHQGTPRTIARLFLDDVPADATDADICRVITRAGLQPDFSEFGIPWANHSVVPESAWPDEVVGENRAPRVPRLIWFDLPDEDPVRSTR